MTNPIYAKCTHLYPAIFHVDNGDLFFIDKIITPLPLLIQPSEAHFIVLRSADEEVVFSMNLNNKYACMHIKKDRELPIRTLGPLVELNIDIAIMGDFNIYFKTEVILLEYDRLKTIDNIKNTP